MWPFKRRSKFDLPDSFWDRVIDETVAGMKEPPSEEMKLFAKAAVKFGEEGALEVVLKDCDFMRARNEIAAEIAAELRSLKQQADQKGEELWMKESFRSAWEVFFMKPNAKTARALLRDVPECKALFLRYFVKHSRGEMAQFASRRT